MRNWWIKFGCFLTGFNYNIVSASSEVAAKAVKRYTSALLIVCILWAFIGYTFSERYLKAGLQGAICGAIVLVIIIIQVERQIILSVHRNVGLYIFRGVIAIMMALIGSIIIDQIIFKEDIEQQKIMLLDEKVKKILPGKTEELKRQIKELDSTVLVKEQERRLLVDDISKNPTIQTVTVQNNPLAVTSSITDSLKNTKTQTKIVHTTSSTVSSMANPKLAMLEPLDQQIAGIRKQKAEKDSALLTLRPAVEQEIRSKVGFLDELKVMQSLITESGVALAVWLIWLGFLLGLELFILFSKIGETSNDYEETVKHQMDLQIKKLKLLAKPVQDA